MSFHGTAWVGRTTTIGSKWDFVVDGTVTVHGTCLNTLCLFLYLSKRTAAGIPHSVVRTVVLWLTLFGLAPSTEGPEVENTVAVVRTAVLVRTVAFVVHALSMVLDILLVRPWAG